MKRSSLKSCNFDLLIKSSENGISDIFLALQRYAETDKKIVTNLFGRRGD